MSAAKNVREAAGYAADKVGDWGGEFAGLIRRNPIRQPSRLRESAT